MSDAQRIPSAEPKAVRKPLGRNYAPNRAFGHTLLANLQPDLESARARTPLGLTVVVPMYQEEAGVDALVDALAAFRDAERTARGRTVEVVVVDDGSTDATAKRLADATTHLDSWLSVVTHDRNRGLTAALRTGAAAARQPAIAWFDSDLTYGTHVLGELVAALEAPPDGADVALASCYHPRGGVEGVAGWRLVLSRGASTLYRACTRTNLHTYTSMVRAYRRPILERAEPARGGFLGVTEVLLRAIRGGARCVEVPAVLSRRLLGHSKMRILRVAFGHLGLLAAWIFGGLRPTAERASDAPRA